MSSIIITCQYCGQKNRIPSNRIDQRAKCGLCGEVIVSTSTSSEVCLLCKDTVSDGVNLSNGKIVHESCLKGLQNRQKEIEATINKKTLELQQVKKELTRQNGLIFKLKSLFFKPKVKIDDLCYSIAKLESEIETLSQSLSIISKELFSIYDYFLSYPPDWDERKLKLIISNGNFCSKCGATSHLHVHHIKPLSKGGTNELSNLMLLCERCHSHEHGGRDFSYEFNSTETAFSKRISAIRYAINNGKKIQFGYKKPTDNGYTQRTVHPIRLEKVNHHRDSGYTLCVRGYCELRKAERIFALKRMRGLKVI